MKRLVIRCLLIALMTAFLPATPGLCATPGDIDGDDRVTLADAVLSLQTVAGATVEGLKAENRIGAAVGLADAIFILRFVADAANSGDNRFQYGDIGVPSDYDATLSDLSQIVSDYDGYVDRLPRSYDARDLGIVQAPKDQGRCGSCWAFTAVGVLEANIASVHGKSLDLSEQQQVSCNAAMGACLGGSMEALKFWTSEGPMLETCTEYAAADMPCANYDHCDPLDYRTADYYTVETENRNDVKVSIYKDGPAYFRYDVYDDFLEYWKAETQGGVYVNAGGAAPSGHAVLIIGWDDDKGAWLCRNSWGATAGPNGDGTFWMSYGGHANDLRFGMANIVLEGQLRMIAPAAGEMVCSGQSHSIRWHPGNAGETVAIDLYRDGVHEAEIAGSAPNSGAYSWPVPDTLAEGADYTITVSSLSDRSIYDETDPFSVSRCGLTVLAPDGGESWAVGAEQTIRWDPSPKGSFVSIYLYRETGQMMMRIAEQASDTGAYAWTIPDSTPTGEDFKIYVKLYSDATISDESDGYFSILANKKPPTADAGPDRTASEGETIMLDGSGSTDPDGEIVSYLWRQTAGPAVTISGGMSSQPSFTTPATGGNENTLTFMLTVKDNDGLTATDVCNVNLSTGPIAEKESNDSFADAQPISQGTYAGQKDESGDVDFFKVTAATTGMIVGFSHVSAYASDSDFIVNVYNAKRDSIGQLKALDGEDKTMAFGVVSGETYYIEVDHQYNTPEGGQYVLTTTFTDGYYEIEPNNDFGDATLIEAGDRVGQKNSSNDSYDYLAVKATDQAMTVGLSHLSEFEADSDFTVVVYDETRTAMGEFDADDGASFEMTFGVVSGQTYYIRVKPHYNTPPERQYRLRISFSNDDYETEPNNDFENAQLHDPGEHIGQRNSSGDSYDYMMIEATDRAMTVGLSHVSAYEADSDFTVVVYDGTQTAMGEFTAQDGNEFQMTFGVVSGQTYYIRVKPHYNTPIGRQYRLKTSFSDAMYETEPNDMFETATSIEAGQYVGNRHSSGDNNDFFQIVAGGGAMSVELTHLTPKASDSDFYVEIYNSQRGIMAKFHATDGVDNDMTVGVASGETYYIGIDIGYNTSITRQYRLTVGFSSDLSYEIEPNDVMDAACTIDPGEYIGQRNRTNDEDDYYAISVSSAGTLSISLSHFTPNATDSDFVVRVYNSQREVMSEADASNGVAQSMEIDVSTGNYYIEVDFGYNTTMERRYLLTVRQTP